MVLFVYFYMALKVKAFGGEGRLEVNKNNIPLCFYFKVLFL